MIFRGLLFFGLLGVMGACSLQKKAAISKAVVHLERDFQEHFGFVLYDPSRKKTLLDYRGDRYYTPASNTKILSLYAGLLFLGDSIPALTYWQSGDSLMVSPTGDPSFLNPYLPPSGAFDFLARAPGSLYLVPPSSFVSPLGSGWAWSDFNSYYSAERSPFPMYANVFTVSRHDTLPYEPYILPRTMEPYKKEATKPADRRGVYRLSGQSNDFIYNPGSGPFSRQIPFHYSDTLLTRMLSDTLKRPVSVAHVPLAPSRKVFFSILADSLYKNMMQPSDNLMAEQLLLLCSYSLWGIMDQDSLIGHMKATYLQDLPDSPQWVDGSGLSRYNLTSPRTIVGLWEKILAAKPRESLFPLLAIGGEAGTIRHWYKGDTSPYVFGKTGTLRNNHALSGFLVTKKGRVLIFSMMHNNYTASTNDLRKEMERILRLIHDHN
jgi:serine-type D-Ala-D-Ala carboxypeptidase/endopeptidase (penicillin-binding protein 4)